MEETTVKSVDKLVDWENPPTVEDLKTDLTSAESDHSDHITNVEGYLEKLAGKLNIKIPAGRSKVQPKLIRTQAEWRYAALEEPFLSTKDMFEINSRTYEDGEGAESNQVVLNYQFNTKMDKVDFINEYVRTATDEGTAIVQVGWKLVEEEKEVDVEVHATPEQAQSYFVYQVQIGAMSQEEALASSQSGEPLVIGTRKEKRIVTVENHPTYRVCEYDKLVIDPTCEGDLDMAEFIISPFETSWSALQRDGSYSNLKYIFGTTKKDGAGAGAESDAEFIAAQSDEEDPTGFEFKDKARKKIK